MGRYVSMSSTIAIAPDQLVSLVYVSSGGREFDDLEIRALLAQARKNNERCGLTGMLLYRVGNFLQVLEGLDSEVESTLQRIQRDPRHRGIMVMKKTAIQTRSFSEWTMAFRKLGSENLSPMEGYSPFMEMSFDSQDFKAQPDFGFRMLLQFKDKMR
jgi:hypothetical protein